MENLTDLNQNPELQAWLAGLTASVQEKSKKSVKEQSETPTVFLPRIDMSKKFSQYNGKSYPEMQGSIMLLPVPYKGQRVVEVNGVLRCWCPIDDEWSNGIMYRILPEEFYPEGPIRNRIHQCRTSLNSMLKSEKISWKECKRQNFSLILALVLSHRNTKGDQVSSTLFGGDTLVEHKNVPALIICPNNMVQSAIKNDLDLKPNAVPYAMACYSDEPLNSRKGWMSLKFTDKPKGGFGYDVTVNTELVNPIVMPDGLLPKDFNFDDERIKLLYTTDPIRCILDKRQLGETEYYNEDTLSRLESFVEYLKNK